MCNSVEKKRFLDSIKKIGTSRGRFSSPTSRLGGGHAIFEAIIYTGHNPLLEMAESSLGAVRK
jgi:hypothetical protein